MDNIAGTPVEGENFYGRESVVTHLQETLINDDILLLGPRRIGKTSVARAVMTAVTAKDWRAVEINVASCVDERGFLDKLMSALESKVASVPSHIISAIIDPLKALSGRIKSLKIPVGAGSIGVELGEAEADDWTKVAGDALRLIAQGEAHWLVYIDELPIMLFNIIDNDSQGGVQRVRRFLDWFRNDVPMLTNAHKVHWLLSGSVGLDTLVQEHGMADTINSLCHEGLAAFSNDEAMGMLSKLAERYNIPLSSDDRQNIVTAVQWAQPYYLQKVFHHLRNLMVPDATASLASLIEKAIDNMLQPGDDNDFHHWQKRLFRQLCRSDADYAVALLNLAAHDPAGAPAETLLDHLHGRMPNATTDEAKQTFIHLRDILQRDAYWWPDETSGAKRYRFHLEPLRRWWVRRDTI